MRNTTFVYDKAPLFVLNVSNLSPGRGASPGKALGIFYIYASAWKYATLTGIQPSS